MEIITPLFFLKLHTVNEQKKNVDEIELLMLMLDQDNDKMLNVDELKVLLSMGGTPANQLDQYASVLMMFDLDKNGKLDLKGKQFMSNFFSVNFSICQIIKD